MVNSILIFTNLIVFSFIVPNDAYYFFFILLLYTLALLALSIYRKVHASNEIDLSGEILRSKYWVTVSIILAQKFLMNSFKNEVLEAFFWDLLIES